MCVTETWATNKINIPISWSKFKVFDVQATRSKATGRASGGLATFIEKEKIQFLQIIASNDSLLAIRFMKDNEEYIFINVYFKPNRKH